MKAAAQAAVAGGLGVTGIVPVPPGPTRRRIRAGQPESGEGSDDHCDSDGQHVTWQHGNLKGDIRDSAWLRALPGYKTWHGRVARGT